MCGVSSKPLDYCVYKLSLVKRNVNERPICAIGMTGKKKQEKKLFHNPLSDYYAGRARMRTIIFLAGITFYVLSISIFFFWHVLIFILLVFGFGWWIVDGRWMAD